MNIWVAYLFLLAAVVFGTASNSYANSASGYTKLMPSIISIIAIVLCMYSLSNGDEKYSYGNNLCIICRGLYHRNFISWNNKI